MRARYPDEFGYVRRAGVDLYYEVFGTQRPTVLFLPTWSLVHSRIWKAQVPYLARHFRVVAFDGRGNGKSSRPTDGAAYSFQELVDDALAVMDETATSQAVIVGYSIGGIVAAMLAANHAKKVEAAIFIAPVAPFGAPLLERTVHSFDDELATTDGWAKHNRHYWQRNYEDWLAFFAARVITEPHSTKQREDVIEWGRETTPDVLIATYDAPESSGQPPSDRAKSPAYYARIRCPVLVIHGTGDVVVSHAAGEGIARASSGSLVTIEGGGHAPHCREPVKVNILIRDFIESLPKRRFAPAEPSRT